MSRFNLIDEKWIPVRFLDGRREELGISDTLLKSREIAAIEDPSPLVVAALHRFLLAVLYRALEGPTDIDQAKSFFKDGLPGEKINAYLEKWRDRFWLFDEKYPFGQIPSFEPKVWRAWTALAAEHNADNAKVLFDHVDVGAPGSISESVAARWILATQTFSVSCGKSELSHTGTAPSATAVMVLPLGRDLQDTLLFSLIPQNREISADDLPVWERCPESVESLKAGIERSSCGLADTYTWRIRSVRLKECDAGGIKKLAFASGVSCSSLDQVDPMLGYRIDNKNGKLPIQFRDKGLWRDFDSLLPDQSHLSPRVIEHAVALTRVNRERFPRSVMILGQANSKAKIEYWRMERFALPRALVGTRSVRTEIRQLLVEAADAESVLERSLRTAAKLSIAKGGRDLQADKWSAGKWKPGDVSKFIGKSTFESVPPVLMNYWSTLEACFHEILHGYSVERDSDDIRCQWLKAVQDALKKAWEQYQGSVSIDGAWVIRALVKAEGSVHCKLRELNDEIEKLEPQEDIV